MRSVKTLILGILLAAMVHTTHAQDATGAAQQVRKSAEQAAQASAPAPAPANNRAAAKSAAQAQPKPAAPVPARSSPAGAPQNKVSAQAASAGKAGTPATAQASNPAAPQAAKSPKSAANKPAVANKPAAKTQSASAAKKPTTKKPATRRAAKAAPKPSSAAANAQANLEGQSRVARRDPFEAMIGRENTAAVKGTGILPAGIHGLQVGTLRLDGVVRAPNGMIAVVSNPQSRTYFLREGDQLYDGRVEKIAMDGVSFHEVGKDAFGKPVERQVNKRIYASAGEQQ